MGDFCFVSFYPAPLFPAPFQAMDQLEEGFPPSPTAQEDAPENPPLGFPIAYALLHIISPDYYEIG